MHLYAFYTMFRNWIRSEAELDGKRLIFGGEVVVYGSTGKGKALSDCATATHLRSNADWLKTGLGGKMQMEHQRRLRSVPLIPGVTP